MCVYVCVCVCVCVCVVTQCLGMIGSKTLPPLIDLLLKTEDMTVRASCAKCIGAVALKYPELLPEFPQSALDGMKKVFFFEKKNEHMHI